MKLKAFLLLLLIAAATAGLVIGTKTYTDYSYEREIQNRFALHGLSVNELEVTGNRVKVKLPSYGDRLCPEDIQRVRYICNAVPEIAAVCCPDKKIYIAVCTPSGEVIYQNLFTTDENEQQIQPSPLYMDSVLLEAKLQYAFTDKDFTCLGWRETSLSQCYTSDAGQTPVEGRILNFSLKASAEETELLPFFFSVLAERLNTEGAGIIQYNLCVTDEDGGYLLLVSYDLLSGTVIRLY